MKILCSIIIQLLAALAVFAGGQGDNTSDTEAWNDGVEYYRAGDVTNALRVLRPLMLTRRYAARSAEVVAKLECERGNLEEAAIAAQIALRANPNDARASRNFARAVSRLAETREMKRVEDALKAAKGRAPDAIMLDAAHEARRLLDEIGGYTTNNATRVVDLSGSISERAQRLSDMLIPVKVALCQAVTNDEQAATISIQIDQAISKTRMAARLAEDIDPGAYSAISDVEHDCTRFLKMTILPPDAMVEDLLAQSNAWQDVQSFNGRDWQKDALDYTRAFRAKFPAWSLAYEQQAQSDTNRPPFTAEDQAKVAVLATELEKLQMECVDAPLPSNQERATDIIRQIVELLPKGGNQSGQGGKDGSQGTQESQPDSSNQDGAQEQEGGANRVQDQDMQESEVGDQVGADNEECADDSGSAKEIETILRKAQERNDEHEADKKARMRKAPLPPNERDW